MESYRQASKRCSTSTMEDPQESRSILKKRRTEFEETATTNQEISSIENNSTNGNLVREEHGNGNYNVSKDGQGKRIIYIPKPKFRKVQYHAIKQKDLTDGELLLKFWRFINKHHFMNDF